MTKKIKHRVLIYTLLLFSGNSAWSQQQLQSSIGWDGFACVGYVDKGAYFNFGGPTIKLIKKPWSIGFGILPTMRIKKDQSPEGTSKNAWVMPTAGFGFTVIRKHIVFQIPFYYNTKSASADGKWNIGIGLGYKI